MYVRQLALLPDCQIHARAGTHTHTRTHTNYLTHYSTHSLTEIRRGAIEDLTGWLVCNDGHKLCCLDGVESCGRVSPSLSLASLSESLSLARSLSLSLLLILLQYILSNARSWHNLNLFLCYGLGWNVCGVCVCVCVCVCGQGSCR